MVEPNKSITKFRIALIGASGAIGREVCDYIMNDSRISEIVILCRRVLPEWKQENFKSKLTLI